MIDASTKTEKEIRKRWWHRKWVRTAGYAGYLLVVIELALQAYYYFSCGAFLFTRTAVPIFRPDEHMGFGVKKNLSYHHTTGEFDTYVFTNGEGFRTSSAHEEYPVQKQASKLRIMLLGPSFAFGWGVNFEETFAHQLSKLLSDSRKASGQDVEMINAGVPAMPPVNQLHWYDKYGKKYGPDLVIQFIYGSMWVTDRQATNQFTVNEQGYITNNYSKTGLKGFREWVKQIATVYYSWIAYTKLKTRFDSKQTPQLIGAGQELAQRIKFNPDDQWTRQSLTYYETLKSTVGSSGSRLMVVYFPLSYAVHPEDINRWSHLGIQNIEAQTSANDDFCKHLNRIGIQCLNITKPLVDNSEKEKERLYYWLDIHWTPKGNRIAAESVYRFLKNKSDPQPLTQPGN